MHQRRLIREAVRNQLLNKTAAAARVYESRVVSYRPRDLPAVAIYTMSETVDPESIETAPRVLRRELDLAIECAVEALDNVDDQLDGLAEQVEREIALDDTLGGTCADCYLASTDVDLFEDGQKLIGVIRLTFTVLYDTDAPSAEDQSLDEFLEFTATYKLGDDQAAENMAIDEVVIREIEEDEDE